MTCTPARAAGVTILLAATVTALAGCGDGAAPAAGTTTSGTTTSTSGSPAPTVTVSTAPTATATLPAPSPSTPKSPPTSPAVPPPAKDPVGIPDNARDYAVVFVKAWADRDTTTMRRLATDQAFTSAEASTPRSEPTLRGCEGAAGSSYCTFTGDEFTMTAGDEHTFSTTWVRSWREVPEPLGFDERILATTTEQRAAAHGKGHGRLPRSHEDHCRRMTRCQSRGAAGQARGAVGNPARKSCATESVQRSISPNSAQASSFKRSTSQ